ncbi:HesA/MoeB/ThiF family protein [Rubellimicrobium roseum]|uniref:HesA/MoeB/ThiF family protein n=1 Tax=Rubellimicrobium roseum TaxID=687525 RepID=A0A5C4N522_9RHOB|nr:HesA/MoeB/ThiF family protein [Rubellimicrobium roseum]TNC60995.1 HesA/MoeB/ThiF family protein [Rubellimicrobium roseum]
MDRYARQLVLPEIGSEGQARLRAASVLVVGAGGLGCPVLSYLAGAGVGRIVIADPDRVEVTNLHRQVLYRMGDIGRLKAEAARDALHALNPDVAVTAVAAWVCPLNVRELVAQADVVVDAADSFALTYLLSDTARAEAKPLVSASVIGLAGYVGAFCAGAPSYRAVFPEVPAQLGSCASAGVLGTAVGVMGALQAHMTLQIVLATDPSPLGRLVSVDLQTLGFGGFSFATAVEPAGGGPVFVGLTELADSDLVVDLRGPEEAPVLACPGAERIAVEDIGQLVERGLGPRRIVLCCRSGLRALRAAQVLRGLGLDQLALVALGD